LYINDFNLLVRDEEELENERKKLKIVGRNINMNFELKNFANVV
jgi:hypothetical protein